MTIQGVRTGFVDFFLIFAFLENGKKSGEALGKQTMDVRARRSMGVRALPTAHQTQPVSSHTIPLSDVQGTAAVFGGGYDA